MMRSQKDFFISYTSADRRWAEWIAWELELAGYSVVIQSWDFRPGSNFVLEMDKASQAAQQTIAVLSPNYLNSPYTHAEWAVAFRQDLKEEQGMMLPVRVEKCDVEGFLGPIVYIDLVGLDEATARERLLSGVQLERDKPDTVPPFPSIRQHSVPEPPQFPGALPSIWNVPYSRNPFFTGREDVLTRLHKALAVEKKATLTRPQAICGLGGIGKTQTAVEYAYHHSDDYRAVLWVRAETNETLVADFVNIATLLNLPEENAQDQSIIVKAVKRWLETSVGWLLIFDNVEDFNIAKEFLPLGSSGRVLLTTRAQVMGGVARRIEIEEMEPEEGALFLLRRANLLAPDASIDRVPVADRTKAKEIVQIMDGLPLALDQAGAYIEETRCTLRDYWQLYQTRRKELLGLRKTLAAEHPEPVSTTWSLSFQKIEQANPAAADLLRFCAFLAPQMIPEELILEGSSELSPALQSAADPFQMNTAIGELLKYSLVRRNPETRTLDIHPLVQAVLKDGMNTKTQRQWVERSVRAVERVFPDVEMANWPLCQRLLHHALACATLIEQWNLAFIEAARLLNQAGFYLWQRGRYAEVEPLYQGALAIREKVLGPEHPDTAQSLNTLAELYRSQGKYEQAEPLAQRALMICEKVLGAEHSATAQSLNTLAELYRSQGKYEQAEPLAQRALTIYERILGSEHLITATTLNTLVELYRSQGKYEQAEPLAQRALMICEKVLGAEHSATAQSLNTLAELYRSQGKYEQARVLYQRALTIYEQILGEHPDTAQSLNNLSQEPLDLGRSYLDKATSLNNLGLLLQEMGNVAEAHLFFELMLKDLERPLLIKRPYTTEQQSAIQEVQNWLWAIIQDMDIAQTSRSRLARPTAINRAIGMLSNFPQQVDLFSQTGRLLIKRVTDRWREVVTREASRAGNIEILTEVASPYIFTVPVDGTALIGRDDLFRRITSLWARPGQRNSLLIHGHRRMGKTSLAQALASRCNLGSDTLLVYFSMETVNLEHEGHLYYEIADRLWLENQNVMAEPVEEEFTASRARTSFNRFLARLNTVIKKSRIVLVLDEFELLQKSLGLEGTGRVISYLRAQTQSYHWIALGLVGLNDLDDLRRSYGNPLLGWEPIRVSFLDTAQVANILANPSNIPDFPLDYAPEALDKIATLTNGQPYLVQVIGDLLVQYYNRTVFTEQQEHSSIFDAIDVQTVVDDPKFYDTAAAYFEGVWDQVTRNQLGEVTMLQVLANQGDGLDQYTLHAATNLDDAAFSQALDALKRHDVLSFKNNRICYTVSLMRHWVHDTHLKVSPITIIDRSEQGRANKTTDLPILTIHIDQPDSNETAPLKLTLSTRNSETALGTLKLPFPLAHVSFLIRALNARQYSDYPTRDRLIRSGEDREEIITALQALGLWDDTISLSSGETGVVPADVHARVGRLLGSTLLTISAVKKFLDTLYNEAIQAGGGEIVFCFHPQAVPFAALPWEVTHNNLQPILLTKGVVLGCTRVITFDHPLPPPRSADQKLRVLTLAPRARMDEAGRAFEELGRNRMKESLRELPVDIESLSIVTMSALRERLSKGPVVDILDYYGHGSFTQDGGALVMENEYGGSDLVTASRFQALGKLLPPFIVLNACQSAQLDTDEPLAGLATALSAAGVRAVLAMQFTTRMPAVTNQFIPILYKELAAGKSLQEAVATIRQALYAVEPDGASWYLPALYLRSPDQQPYFLLSKSNIPSSLGEVEQPGKMDSDYTLLTQFTLPPNPFAGSGALEDAKRFIGHESQIQRLWSRLSVGSNLTIIGSAGSGKSAMLRLIAEEAQKRLNLPTEVIQVPLYPTIKRSDVHKWLVSWMGGQREADLIRLLKNRHLILLLDDLGLLDKGSQGLEVRSWLRQLSQSRQVGRVQLVATSKQPLHNIFKEDRPSDGSPLHDAMRDIIELVAFDKKEAKIFIEKALVGTPFKVEDFMDLLNGSLMPGGLQEHCRDRYDELCERKSR